MAWGAFLEGRRESKDSKERRKEKLNTKWCTRIKRMLLLPSFLADIFIFITRLLLALFWCLRLVLDIACYAFHSLVVSQVHAPRCVLPLPLSLFLLLSFYVLFWIFGTSFHRLPFFVFDSTSDGVSSYLSHISFRLLVFFKCL